MKKAWFFLLGAFWVQSAFAYPEFQTYFQKKSGRAVDCALCHTHPNGPEGAAPGQIGALTPAELEKLARAHSAFEAGNKSESPVLNDFGNSLLQVLGRKNILEARFKPEMLVERYDPEKDLDGDGIPDARELLDGTHPLNDRHGNPWLLFKVNFKRQKFHVVMIFLATLITLYGIAQVARGLEGMFALHSRESAGEEKEGGKDG